jgi:hypothetical protein
MDTPFDDDTEPTYDIRVRDAIIHALYLKLRAELETREAIINAARSGAAPEVLEAMASDPIPTINDFGEQPTVRALVKRLSKGAASRPPQRLDVGR